MKPLILDSALGTELENRGEYLPSFKTSIWSAYCLIHNPEVIKQIHIDNIEAGADVITTSNYQATPELLKREPTAPLYEDLAKRSLELCLEAVIKCGTQTKIAGCFPPIHVTFRPDLSSKEKQLRKFYETLGKIYQDQVDIIICETMASIYEGTVAAATAKKFSDTVWLSWTTRGNKLNRLPSTELLDLAISEGLKLDIDCQLVNCVHADTASLAIEKLKQEKSFGIYANSSIYKKNMLEGFVSDSDEWHHHNTQPIDHDEYKEFVAEWINSGASVIGGCCRTSIDHIKEIKKIVDKL
ncbi:homocysteine S-methyltransferase family protein [Gammaproteobacteria bacterium]|nr:homocysteine S-methyltransferase family protein [Gammaproteobacteria bacterium]